MYSRVENVFGTERRLFRCLDSPILYNLLSSPAEVDPSEQSERSCDVIQNCPSVTFCKHMPRLND